MRKLCLVPLLVLLVWSCKNKPMTPEAYVDFAQKEEDINVLVEKEDFLFKCSYRPVSYMAISEMANQIKDENAKSIFENKRKEMGNGFYVAINITSRKELPIMITNNGDRMLIPAYLQGNEVLKAIELKTKDGSVYSPLQLIYNNQGNTPTLSMVMVFEKTVGDLNQPFSVTYNNTFWGTPEKITWEFGIKPLDFEREIIF